MGKNNINWKKIFAPSDTVAFIVIIVGLLMAIFIDEIAIKLIGFSIVVLGSVALFMLISQRLSETIESQKFSSGSSPGYKISIKQGTDAKRQVFEDYNDSLAEDHEHIEPESILSPDAELYNSKPENSENPLVTEQKNEDLNFQDKFSGVRIIGKSKSSSNEESQTKIETNNDAQGFRSLIENQKSKVVEPPIENIKTDAGTIQSDVDLPSNDLNSAAAAIETSKNEETLKIEESDKIEINNFNFVENQKETIPITVADEVPLKSSNAEIINQIPNKSNEEIDNISEIGKKLDFEIVEKTDLIDIEVAQSKEKYKEHEIDFNLSELMDIEEIEAKEPRKEFNYFLRKVLGIIKELTGSTTTAFIMVNPDKGQLVIEAYQSDYISKITPSRKVKLTDDAVSNIYKEVKPEILTEINSTAVLDLIPYYLEKIDVKSFVGVPVFFKNKVIGVLCADSLINNAYDSYTIKNLSHFTKLLSGLVSSYTEKYDLVQSSKTLKTINSFIELSTLAANDPAKLTNYLLKSISGFVDYDKLGLVLFDDDSQDWKVMAIRTREPNNDTILGKSVDLENSLLGYSITKSKTIFINDETRNVTRFNNQEELSKFNSFLCVPIKTSSANYGSLFIEGRNKNSISTNDIEIIENLIAHASNAFDILRLNSLMTNQPFRDYNQEILNPSILYDLIRKEAQRVSYGIKGFSFAIIKLDNYSIIDPVKYPGRMEIALDNAIGVIRKNIKTIDYIGKIDDELIGLILTGNSALDSKIWAEKLKNEIVNSPIQVDNITVNSTVSIGIAEYKDNLKIDVFINNCMSAFNQAYVKSNSVVVYN